MDEYSTGGGGKLKLKGSKVSDGRVKKKKSKKSSSAGTATTTGTSETVEKDRGNEDAAAEGSARSASDGAEGENGSSSTGTLTPAHIHEKTEAERRLEEMRRKRVQERLKREGVKTHKERVEELNKYLSRLSEHHDMPKIGPG
ncbi:hypothetical protein BDW75DRAFT_208084 [Aspergillus navahoensis]